MSWICSSTRSGVCHACMQLVWAHYATKIISSMPLKGARSTLRNRVQCESTAHEFLSAFAYQHLHKHTQCTWSAYVSITRLSSRMNYIVSSHLLYWFKDDSRGSTMRIALVRELVPHALRCMAVELSTFRILYWVITYNQTHVFSDSSPPRHSWRA